MIKSNYINDILNLLLDSDNDGLFARQQIPFLTDTKFEYTNSGLFVSFEHSIGIEIFRTINENLVLDGVEIKSNEIRINAQATLFFKEGLIDTLEIWCYKGVYPKLDLNNYILTQTWLNSKNKTIYKTNMIKDNTKYLYRPVNQPELDLIEQSGWTKFPPRLPEQPIFYPVMNEEYAIQISKEWNVPTYGIGYVTRFAVNTEYLAKFKVENVGGQIHNELWIPAEELEEFNSNIVGLIEVTKVYKKE